MPNTNNIVLMSEDAANADKETGSPLQTEAREEQRGGGRAGPCRSDEPVEEC